MSLLDTAFYLPFINNKFLGILIFKVFWRVYFSMFECICGHITNSDCCFYFIFLFFVIYINANLDIINWFYAKDKNSIIKNIIKYYQYFLFIFIFWGHISNVYSMVICLYHIKLVYSSSKKIKYYIFNVALLKGFIFLMIWLYLFILSRS